MKFFFSVVTALALAWMLVQPAAAAPCAGFQDVDGASPFCPSVEWLRNRGVTRGCVTGSYCPDQTVSRLSMAAFMNRLGTALTPLHLVFDGAPGIVLLDTPKVVCETADFVVAAYPRRAHLDLAFAGFAPASIGIAADLVVTDDNGSTWTPINAFGNRGAVGAGQWGSLSSVAMRDLDVGQIIRFGVRLTRISGSANLTDSRCNLRAAVTSRDGTVSPF